MLSFGDEEEIIEKPFKLKSSHDYDHTLESQQNKQISKALTEFIATKKTSFSNLGKRKNPEIVEAKQEFQEVANEKKQKIDEDEIAAAKLKFETLKK